MEIEITSDLKATVLGEKSVQPIIFVPDVNVQTLEEPSIIESF